MFWLMELIFSCFMLVSGVALYLGFSLLGDKKSILLDWVFFRVGGMDMGILILFDWMSLIFCGVVLLISGCVFYYMVGYMSGDKTIVRFGLLVFLFVISMVCVIFSPSFISILLGWDGLGLVSYCLVIYYGNFKSYNAGMITGVSNRVGDVGLLLTIGFLFMYGSWDFYMLEGHLGWWIMASFVVLAGFTKSAQIPFSAWLPAAMAAPTPVSALVHSSTLVTAGVYLFIRFYGVISGVWWLGLVILYGGVITLFMAGLSALFEQDMKKIIALSTLSQLGVMMVSVGVGNVDLAFFHLICHAIFKALLFLCGGKMIHSFGGYQDVRFMGGIVMGLPVSCVSLNVANFSLCGFPFMAGFYSKDLILEGVGFWGLNLLCVLMLMVGVMFTCMYTASFCWYSMVCYYGGGGLNWEDMNFYYLIPKIILSLGGIIGGSLFFWVGVSYEEYSGVYGLMSTWPLIIMLIGILSGVLLVYTTKSLSGPTSASDFWWTMWFIPNLSISLVKYPFISGDEYFNCGDQGWSEVVGGQGLYNLGGVGGKSLFKSLGGLYGLVIYVCVIWLMLGGWVLI
uniref:NADH-ubiquinone oxidoreductase chain 5 n=1 Tax=Xystodesmus sp. YD-2016 TaxID=1904352 RepID=A0A1S5RSA3_9MYRI|nr:NADH dehydrogenase subunit 5 [Xystodesmus sp. YD-2016]